ncbi:hypothetical protein AJ80_05201 [Polytolypa hystricis UAMH7299]|uniref:DUF3431 domain-containing protein n=1 Tax=Polytolypa hystricis (strain UAMH7299) TaxID=1447883 RepID=A0A2B7Y652_POLH7|nr:hypothetical protein AJ80_05201 [Polytolypa hystricis UAMH7299]
MAGMLGTFHLPSSTRRAILLFTFFGAVVFLTCAWHHMTPQSSKNIQQRPRPTSASSIPPEHQDQHLQKTQNTPSPPTETAELTTQPEKSSVSSDPEPPFPSPNFQPGVAKPAGSNYTRVLVIARQQSEDVNWINEELPDLETAVYVVDDPNAEFHPPRNKGHEAMVYLSYVIDHYDELPDIMIFMHAHRQAWHNEEILDWDAVKLIQRLSSERVTREGYMNLRCKWGPGCPDWIRPREIEEDTAKREQLVIAEAWTQLFPHDEKVPEVLAQPCCAQLALSRDRVRAIPLSRFMFYRDWLLNTPLSDSISGRVWEYLWQVVFTGQQVFCPLQHVCYCDGYGLCFGGEDGMNEAFGVQEEIGNLREELKHWQDKAQAIRDAVLNGASDEELAELNMLDPERKRWLEEEIPKKGERLKELKERAIERGKSPQIRAEEVGREWRDGDGF